MKKFKTSVLLLGLFTFFCSSLLADEAKLTSWQKIENALTKKEITEATAAGFKVLAFFNDPELPPKYQTDPGAIVPELPDNFIARAMKQLPQMDIGLAASAYRYMIPPAYLDHSNQKGEATVPTPNDVPNNNWAFIDDVTASIRVWYEKDNQDQIQLAKLIHLKLAKEIIPVETKLMGRSHLADHLNTRNLLVSAGIERAQPNGGDGKLDVYIYNLPPEANTRAWVQPYDVEEGAGCVPRPGYLAVNLSWAQTATPERIASTLAHEYFHTIQISYDRKGDCTEYDNMDEGTATYIKHFVYPNYNHEHEWFEFFEDGRQSLMDAAYATWPFYYFMVEMQGSDSLSKLHSMMEQHRAIEALNSTLKGGFKEQWVDYAVYEWNQDPLQDGFFRWDNYKFLPGRGAKDNEGHLPPIKVEKVTLDQDGQYRYDMKLELKQLTRDFFAFDLTDPEIRSIAIENPVFWNAKKINVKALVRKKGQTQFEELLWDNNQRQEYHYCFDKKDQDIDQIVIVVANYQHSKVGKPYTGKPGFKVTNLGCHGYKGKISSYWDTVDKKMEQHLQVDVTNVTYIENGESEGGVFKNNFYNTTGTLAYSYNGRIEDCSGFKAGFLDIKFGPKSTLMGLASYNVKPEAWGDYVMGIEPVNPFITVTYVCPPPKKSFEWTVPVAVVAGFNGAQKHKGDPVLRGESKNVSTGWGSKWEFHPFKE